MMMHFAISHRPEFPDAEGPWAIWQDRLAAAFCSAKLGLQQQHAPAIEVNGGVATVNISGIMSRLGSFAGGTSTEYVTETIRNLGADPEVSGIILRVNSPGGMYTGTRDLADAIKDVTETKPVYAYIEDVGASAAYWAASQATRIIAAPDSMVGSIGTFTVIYDASQMAETSGITVHVVRAEQSGEMKGAGTFGAPVTETQLAEMKKLATSRNQFFLDAVSRGRNITGTSLAQIADGRVFIAAEAVDLGLVDEVATYAQALKLLTEETSGIQGDVMTTNDNIAAAQQDEVAPIAARPLSENIADYRAACPSASDTQILNWLAAGTDLVEAMASHIANLEAQIANTEEKAEETVKSKEAVEATSVEPHGSNPASSTSEVLSASGTWKAKLRELEKQGMGKRDAVSTLTKAEPELWREYIQEVNSGASL